MSNYPQRKGELIQSASTDGWTVYEPETDALHVLNASAKAIWELCDGETTAEEMAGAISEITGLGWQDAASDLASTLKSLRRLGLISYESAD